MATVEVKKIQIRHGNEADLDPSKLIDCEPVNVDDTKKFGIKQKDGTILWMATLDPVTKKLVQMPSPSDIGCWHIGAIEKIAYATADNGWLLCRGQAISRATYSALFAKIGTTYGVGDGSTTFNLPLPGRVSLGLDPSQEEFNTLGKYGGSKTATINYPNLPSGVCALGNNTTDAVCAGNPSGGIGTGGTGFGQIKDLDSRQYGQALSILPPYQIFNEQIYTGVFN